MYKKQICRIRMPSHNLAIEQGRHTNTTINNRNCKLCHSDIEDEFHFVLKCPHLELCNLGCYLQHALERLEIILISFSV